MTLPSIEAVAALRAEVVKHRAKWVAKRPILEEERRTATRDTFIMAMGRMTDCSWRLDRFNCSIESLDRLEERRKVGELLDSFLYDTALETMNMGIQGSGYVK